MSLFADDLTVFVGNLIEFTKKEILWKTQGILERVQDTKLIYKSQFISYVSERTSGIWNLNHFILCISTQKMKYLAIKLTKYIQDLHEENKNLWRMKWKKKKNLINGAIFHVWVERLNIVKISVLPNFMYRFNSIII